ncbi:MAG: hypothetical protein D6784_02690 [Chloroflexi bacterium]|nr:MAG: hypothetical protein D6784_02690 [Chloroflexota bacterium]
MAKVAIDSGACGLHTTIEAVMNGRTCRLNIDSECEAIRALAEELGEVDPFQEISFRGNGPKSLALGAEHCYHTACPVPVGIIKAVEVAAGLNLPVDASIKFIDD